MEVRVLIRFRTYFYLGLKKNFMFFYTLSSDKTSGHDDNNRCCCVDYRWDRNKMINNNVNNRYSLSIIIKNNNIKY